MAPTLRLADLDPITASCHVSLVAPPGRWRFDPHAHDFLEALCVRSGTVTHSGVGGDVELNSGDIALVPLGAWHALRSAVDRTEIVNVAFPAPMWLTLLTFTGLSLPVSEDVLVSRAPHSDDRRRRISCFSEVLSASRGEEPGPGVVRFLVDLGELLAQPTDSPPPATWFARTLECVHDEEVVAGGLHVLLGKVGVSYAHLARTCRRELGCTPTELINRARVDRAKLLLTTTSLPILAVAQRCGFATLSRFYSVFRAHCGATPGEFRTASYQGLHPAGRSPVASSRAEIERPHGFSAGTASDGLDHDQVGAESQPAAARPPAHSQPNRRPCADA